MLVFKAGEVNPRREIVIQIINNDAYEADEAFEVGISPPSFERPTNLELAALRFGKDHGFATVYILDDDHAGKLGFATTEFYVLTLGGVDVKVLRTGGCRGTVSATLVARAATSKSGEPAFTQVATLQCSPV